MVCEMRCEVGGGWSPGPRGWTKDAARRAARGRDCLQGPFLCRSLFLLLFFFFLVALGLRCCCMQAFSGFGARASHCRDVSCCRAQALGARASVAVAFRLSSCGAWAELLPGMWNRPRPGVEPVSPSSADGFLTTRPPGKSSHCIFFFFFSFMAPQ